MFRTHILLCISREKRATTQPQHVAWASQHGSPALNPSRGVTSLTALLPVLLVFASGRLEPGPEDASALRWGLLHVVPVIGVILRTAGETGLYVRHGRRRPGVKNDRNDG